MVACYCCLQSQPLYTVSAEATSTQSLPCIAILLYVQFVWGALNLNPELPFAPQRAPPL